MWNGNLTYISISILLKITDLCCKTCTVAYAAAKLIYSNRLIKKHTKLAQAQRAHLGNIRSSRHIIQLKPDEVPFGIKALESGIEVEGVVISRSCTPGSSLSQQTLIGSDDGKKSRGISVTSPGIAPGIQMRQTGRPMVYQPSPYISFPAPAHCVNSGMSSIRSSSSSIASIPLRASAYEIPQGFTVRASSDPILPCDYQKSPTSPPACPFHGSPTPRSSLGFVPDPLTLARLEGRLHSSPPPSFLRRTPSPMLYSPPYPSSRTQTRTPSPSEGQLSPKLPSVHEDFSEASSEESDSSTEHGRLPGFPRGVPNLNRVSASSGLIKLPETVAGDLALLHTHRLSHAAEVGQLFPRIGRNHCLPTNSFNGPFTACSTPSVSPATSNLADVRDIPVFPTAPTPTKVVDSHVSIPISSECFRSYASHRASAISTQNSIHSEKEVSCADGVSACDVLGEKQDKLTLDVDLEAQI
jgi:hypothetical protein